MTDAPVADGEVEVDDDTAAADDDVDDADDADEVHADSANVDEVHADSANVEDDANADADDAVEANVEDDEVHADDANVDVEDVEDVEDDDAIGDDVEDDEDVEDEDDTGNRVVGAIPRNVVEYIARNIVDEPDAVVVEADERNGRVDLRLHVAPDDMGKIIGKRGRVAQAIRAVVRAAGAREGVEASVDIVD